MKESNIFVIGVTIIQLQNKILFYIKGQFMRELNIHAYFAAMKQIKRSILKNIDSLWMM